MTPLSVLCWKWKPAAGYRSKFGPDTVRILRNMVARHYPQPHRFICVCDTPKGIDADIETYPLWPEWGDLPSPHGGRNPSCYRRLHAFRPDIGDVFGPRFVSLDLDTVIVGDLRPLWDRPEDFVIWGDTDYRSWYNGSMWLMNAGARPQVYTRFDPKTSPQEAKAAGRLGSDQSWISHVLGKGEAMWSTADGVYSYRVHIQPLKNRLPDNARIIMTHGHQDPWDARMKRIDFVRRHYR